MGGGGTPAEQGQSGGDHCGSQRRLRLALLPEALGVAPGKGPEMSSWPAHFEKCPQAVTRAVSLDLPVSTHALLMTS